MLSCEWQGCNEMSPTLTLFMAHIEDHLRQQPADDLICGWIDCGHLAGTTQEYILHVNFHAFHTKIKCLGANLLLRKGLKSCLLNGSSRNLIPELPDSMICGWANCAVVFNNPELYYRHVDEHVEDGAERDVKCLWEECGGQFTSGHKMRDHFRSHTQEKLIACPKCGGLFSNRTKFFDHIKRQTPLEDQQYQCSHCSKRLASERLLRDHMRNHINHYKCPLCDMTCSSPSNLSNHMRYRHSTERPYACNFCEYSGKSQADLCKHLRTHLSEPQFKCPNDVCGYVTRSAHTLKLHVLKEHKKNDVARYICHLCQKTFARGAYLTRHLFRKHKFRWPSGHCRFRYKRNPNGNYELQTIRYESIELTQEMIDQVNDEAGILEESIDVDTMMEEASNGDSSGMEDDDDDDYDDDRSEDMDESSGQQIVSQSIQDAVDIPGTHQPESLTSSKKSTTVPPRNGTLGYTSLVNEVPVSVDAQLSRRDEQPKFDFMNARGICDNSRESNQTVLATVTGPDGVTQQIIQVLVSDGVLSTLEGESHG